MSSKDKKNNLLFTLKELEFIKNNEICRIASSYNDKPHVVPVCYIYLNNFFYFATDYETKKYHNLVHNNNICLVIDEYDPIHGNRALVVSGSVHFIERGSKFIGLYRFFEKKFPWVKKSPWKEDEAPFVEINIDSKVSWGL